MFMDFYCGFCWVNEEIYFMGLGLLIDGNLGYLIKLENNNYFC